MIFETILLLATRVKQGGVLSQISYGSTGVEQGGVLSQIS